MNEDDVDGSSLSGAIGTGNEERIAKLSAINAANDVAGADQLADINDDGTTSPFVADPIEGEEVTEIVPEVVDPAPEIVEPDTTHPVRFKLKVNGREIELTQEELIARAQKVESADQYLADAAAAKRAAVPVLPKAELPSPEDLRAQRDEEDRAIVRAIQMGTEEEALLAVRKLEDRRARPSVTADDMSRAIDERLAFNEAISVFRKDFADIAGDPLLNQLALQRDSALVDAGDRRPYAERYAQIGKELSAWKESLVPAPKAEEPPQKDTSLEDKAAKKAAAPKPVVAATKKVVKTVPEDEDGEEDASSVIANIAKARGGPQWMRN